MHKGKKIFVIIPALNEEKTIKEVITGIPSFVDTIMVIDDGSRDNTAGIAEKYGAVVISHESTYGVGTAFQTGVEYALKNNCDIMVNIDGDGQFSPEEIPKVIEPLIAGEADFVTGSRFLAESRVDRIPRIKKWGNKRMSWLVSRLTKNKFFDVSCGFRAYSRMALQRLNLHSSFTYTQESFIDLAFKKLRIKEVPIHVTYFPGRKSRTSHNLIQYVIQSLRIVFRTYRDYRPLAFFWTLGMILVFISLFFGFILLWHRITTGHFTGQIWAGFVGAFFFILGLIFFFIGVIGDILLRIRLNQESIMYLLKRSDSQALKSEDEGGNDPYRSGD
jgi:glycosyltransferase involved in cell wall biosynthesis